MIWFKQYSLDELNRMAVNTLLARLDIEFTAIGDASLEARMPVNQHTIQPAGILHGGASVALAETIASVGAYLTVDPDLHTCVGLEINANHIKAMRSGWVYGKGYPFHLGKSTQIWKIEITDENNSPVCSSRMTIMVLDKKD